jgi:hypothetical protein
LLSRNYYSAFHSSRVLNINRIIRYEIKVLVRYPHVRKDGKDSFFYPPEIDIKPKKPKKKRKKERETQTFRVIIYSSKDINLNEGKTRRCDEFGRKYSPRISTTLGKEEI